MASHLDFDFGDLRLESEKVAVPPLKVDFFCIDNQERLGYDYTDKELDDSNVVQLSLTLIELLLPREDTLLHSQPQNVPEVDSRIDLSNTSILLHLVPEIWMMVFDRLHNNDALCLALSCRFLYNIGRQRLQNLLCCTHLGQWAGKQLVFLQEEEGNRIRLEDLVYHQDVYKGVQGPSAEEALETTSRIPFDHMINYPSLLSSIKAVPQLNRFHNPGGVEDYRAGIEAKRALVPDSSRLQDIWIQNRAGIQFIPLPTERIIKARSNVMALHLSIIDENDSYVLRNLSKRIWIVISPYPHIAGANSWERVIYGYLSIATFLRTVVGYDSTTKGSFGPWFGDRLEIVKMSRIANEAGWTKVDLTSLRIRGEMFKTWKW